MALELAVPGYDCFIKQHNTAFTAGSVIAQIAVAAVMIVGTLGAGSVLVAARYAAQVGVKFAVKAALREARQVAIAAGRSFIDEAGSVLWTSGGRQSLRSGDEVASTVVNASRHTPDEQALHALASEGKRNGVTRDEAQTLREWADELGWDQHRPMIHPGRPGFGGTTLHINIGNVKHIPVLEV